MHVFAFAPQSETGSDKLCKSCHDAHTMTIHASKCRWPCTQQREQGKHNKRGKARSFDAKDFFTISQLSVSFIDPLLHASLPLTQWYTISTMLTPLTPASFTQIYELLLFLLLGGHSWFIIWFGNHHVIDVTCDTLIFDARVHRIGYKSIEYLSRNQIVEW